MTANPPHPPGPGESHPADPPDANALSGGTHGILAVTMATLGLSLAAAGIAAAVAWLV